MKMKKISSLIGLAREFAQLANAVLSVVRQVIELVSSAINYPARHALL